MLINDKYGYSKKTEPWNGHSSVIFPSLKPEGISKDGTNINMKNVVGILGFQAKMKNIHQV